MTHLPPDHFIRERAVDPRASFHLEAPAGSGKTAVLLARFLTLLARVEHSLQEILVLTFTRKAAGEFRDRVLKYFLGKFPPEDPLPAHERRLQELAAETFRHLDRKNLLSSLSSPERLPVMTFHAFCVQLLRAAPDEAGVPLEFRLLESETETAWLRREAIEELRRRLAGRPVRDPVRQALVRRLVRLNNNWPRLAQELGELLGRRDTLREFVALAHGSQEPEAYAELMAARFRHALQSELQVVARRLRESTLGRNWGEFYKDLNDKNAPLGSVLPAAPPTERDEDLPVWRELARALLTQDGKLRKRFSTSEGFYKDFGKSPWPEVFGALPEDFLADLKRFRDDLEGFAEPRDLPALEDLILLLSSAWEVYDAFCRERGVLDFVAVEEAALRLLDQEDPGELLLRVDWRLRHLLVDEFQDTSDNQKEILCRLTAGWEEGDGRTLTVVGDPKQSIYAWRQARVRLFLEAKHGLPCDSGRPLPLMPLLLTVNFRTTRRLIAWVNQVFGATVMAAPCTTEEPAFKEALPRPGAPEGEAPRLCLFVRPDLEGRQDEARWLARQLARVQEELPPREKAALLLFARTHLPVYLSAFYEAGLVPRVREGLFLRDSRVVQHLHNLARALVRPQDEVAWAGVLAGPWGRPEAEVLAGVAKSPGAVWPEKLLHWAQGPDCPPGLARLAEQVDTARTRLGREPLVDTLRGFLTAGDAWEPLAAWEGALGVANARAYLRLVADSHLGLPEATFEKVEFELQNARQVPDPRAQDSPLEVLTVHAAKGLEFHTVFLPFLDWSPLRRGGSPPPFLLEEIPGRPEYGVALAPPYWEERKPPDYRVVENLRKKRLVAEARRLFYVAVTRAKERLFLSGVLKVTNGRPSPPDQSPLGWLWRHYAPAGLPGPETGVWEAPPLEVQVHDGHPAPEPREAEGLAVPKPLEFQPQPLPYRLNYPSAAAAAAPDKDSLPPEGGAWGGDTDTLLPRVRGEVLHRLLETLARGEDLPGETAVGAALRSLGLPREEAARLAPELLAEAAACAREPFLARLLAGGGARPEWLLEDAPAAGSIRRGRLDLLARDGDIWWLLDFKTSRPAPGEPVEAFLARETEHYRPQLLAYREMVAKTTGLPTGALRPAVYFTALRQMVEV